MELPLLSILWLAPLAGMLLLMMTREKDTGLIRTISAAIGLFILGLSLIIYWQYKPEISGYQLTEQLAFWPGLGISYHLGVDGINVLMVVLSGILAFTAIMVSFSIKERIKEYFILMMVALSGVLGLFVSLDLFFFILFYELASIPMYFLIGIWGSDKMGEGREVKRKDAALKLIIYLQLGGGLILLGFLGLYFFSGLNTFDLVALSQAHIPLNFQLFLFPLLFIAFGIEAGLFPFHTWLPDGHSAAPTALSMLLAGVLLKMGGYGIVRVVIGTMPEAAMVWMKFFCVIAVINVLYGAYCAIKQTDIKYLIAYSSISHMGIVFLGFGVFNDLGMQGAIYQMFSHGIITALLFAMAGYIYEKTHTKVITQMGGLAVKAPFLAVLFGIGGFATLGLPGFSGFIAELMVFLGAVKVYPWLAITAILGLVITATYILRAIQKIFYGPLNPKYEDIKDLQGVEKVGPYTLAIVAWLAGFFPFLLTGVMNNTVTEFLLKFGGGRP